jgi:5-methylcytosine-specific restriction endonuclease McrA
MDKPIRHRVRERAGNRCEYCRLPQAVVDATFHVDHVIAQQHVDEAEDDPDDLALACDRCNLYKGTNLSSVDPNTRQVVPLFNPRQDIWEEHFAAHGAEIIGLTPTGRATVRLPQMNARQRVQLRRWLMEEK